MSRPAPQPILWIVHSSGGSVSHEPRRRPLANAFEPRDLRLAFPVTWGRFIRTTMPNRETVAAVYGVTFQTACNWWDDAVVPMGDKVVIAQTGWPDDFARIVLGRDAADVAPKTARNVRRVAA